MSAWYQYFAHKSAALAAGRPDYRVLDCGCGDGEMLTAIRQAGVNCVGAEVFFAASNARQVAEEKGLLNTLIFEIKDGILPFPDHSFDLVVSNQVFEHVEDLEGLLKEIKRVLKPDGQLLAAFPLQDCIMEYHMRVPFTHWFPKGSSARIAYTTLAHRVGLGNYRNRPRAQWVRDKLHYLDAYCFFRTRKEVEALMGRHFAIRFIDPELIHFRLEQKPVLAPLSKALDALPLDPLLTHLHHRIFACLVEANPLQNR